jgi:hypothetical protein
MDGSMDVTHGVQAGAMDEDGWIRAMIEGWIDR